MSSKTTIALAALLAASALSSAPAAAAEQEDGMVVVRDARTGQFRNPTPAEVKVLRAQQTQAGMARRELAPAAVTVRENGTRQKHLGERSMVYSVVTRDPGGKLGMQCVNGEDAANAALMQPAPVTQQEHNHEIR